MSVGDGIVLATIVWCSAWLLAIWAGGRVFGGALAEAWKSAIEKSHEQRGEDDDG